MSIISQIEIKNIKGIDNKCFNVQLIPNKPNLLVAPNGFGKSSIATAFSSMNSKRIILADKDYHKEDTSLSPELSIVINSQKITANQTQNEIWQQFDTMVINSGLIPKAKKGYQGSISTSLEVKSIKVCNIPEKTGFDYKISDIKATFGTNGKVLSNINELLSTPLFLDALENLEIHKFNQKRIQTSLISIIERINQQSGSTSMILQWISTHCLTELRNIQPLNGLTQRLIQLSLVKSEIEGFLAAYQIAMLYTSDTKKFNAATEWLKYTSIKSRYNNLLSNFCSSKWQWAKTIEDNKKKILSIVFPKAHQLSNGQRDLITLVIHLHKTLYEGSKKPLILIIDEVFDYLDDANLVSFQYYFLSIIETYKEREQIIYPIILSHLDPGVFFHFCFNNHKIQINHLLAKPIGKAKDTLKLIKLRDTLSDDTLLKIKLEKYWFHYHTNTDEIPVSEWPRDLPSSWICSDTFNKYITTELSRYLNGQNYDPLAVCFAVRIGIERVVFNLLTQDDQKEQFLNVVRKTKNKIEFVESFGIDIPEIYYLLGLIYNTNLHWTQGRDYISPLVEKLNHPTIKNLISCIFKDELNIS